MTQTPITPIPAPHSVACVAAITETVTRAFATDPTWGPYLSPDPTDLAVAGRYWGFFVSSAQRYPCTFVTLPGAGAGANAGAGAPEAGVPGTSVPGATTGGGDSGGAPAVAATAVWYPPGSEELTSAEAAGFPNFAADLLGASKRDELLEVADRFDAAHPVEPHFYLSLLATNPAHRGLGHGMRLLAANLRTFDQLGVPTYLESSNPDNDRRYMSLGYKPHGSIELPTGLRLTTFWREPSDPPAIR